MAEDQEMTAPQSNGTKEIGINKPTKFDGDRRKFRNFLQECTFYITVNETVYDTDAKKIAFILSHMTDKEALLWKQQYVDRHIIQEDGTVTWPLFKDFTTKLKEDFRYEDQIRNATNQLETIRQGKRTAEELVTEFKLLVGQARLTDETTSDNNHLIRLFQKALNPVLTMRILTTTEKVPTTIQDWYRKAIEFDGNY